MAGRFVVSLDFEMFWGVAESRAMDDYRGNIEGVWTAIPRILDTFRRYRIRATWATVGMVMCNGYYQWRDVRPSVYPGYRRKGCSTYSLDTLARENPRLFFARPLVEQVLMSPGQEVGGHSYSHLYCSEAGVRPEHFAADLVCARNVGAEIGVNCRSFVFPRNQVAANCLPELVKAGYKVYRGNPQHWLYAAGHRVSGGAAGRGARLLDAYVSISGNNTSRPECEGGLFNCAASFFFRPWSPYFSYFETLRIHRLKCAMSAAAQAGEVFHLWWHPHNFGVYLDQNLVVLEAVLKHYRFLHDRYGMQSSAMGDFAMEALP